MRRSALCLTALLLACAPADEPIEPTPTPEQVLSGDLDLDPEVLADLEQKADGDPCADYPGGPLTTDELLVLINREEGQQLSQGARPDDLVALDDGLLMPGRKGHVRATVRAAYRELANTALAEAGFDFRVRSAFRSFQTQCFTFDYWVKQKGFEHANRYSAQPGRSQHQLGTTIDVTTEAWSWDLVPEVGLTPEAAWIAENAWRFGFALSYPEGAEEVTGYGYEPWHFRYIGLEAAKEMHEAELILEAYLQACAQDEATREGALSCPEESILPLPPNFEFIGAPCGSDLDCAGVGEGAVCLTDHPNGGMCSKPCEKYCPDQPGASSTFCVANPTEEGAPAAAEGLCHSRCDHDLFGDSGCREGYVCSVGQRPNEGQSGAVCLPQ